LEHDGVNTDPGVVADNQPHRTIFGLRKTDTLTACRWADRPGRSTDDWARPGCMTFASARDFEDGMHANLLLARSCGFGPGHDRAPAATATASPTRLTTARRCSTRPGGLGRQRDRGRVRASALALALFPGEGPLGAAARPGHLQAGNRVDDPRQDQPAGARRRRLGRSGPCRTGAFCPRSAVSKRQGAGQVQPEEAALVGTYLFICRHGYGEGGLYL